MSCIDHVGCGYVSQTLHRACLSTNMHKPAVLPDLVDIADHSPCLHQSLGGCAEPLHWAFTVLAFEDVSDRY
jgi:hypothetical protein